MHGPFHRSQLRRCVADSWVRVARKGGRVGYPCRILDSKAELSHDIGHRTMLFKYRRGPTRASCLDLEST